MEDCVGTKRALLDLSVRRWRRSEGEFCITGNLHPGSGWGIMIFLFFAHRNFVQEVPAIHRFESWASPTQVGRPLCCTRCAFLFPRGHVGLCIRHFWHLWWWFRVCHLLLLLGFLSHCLTIYRLHAKFPPISSHRHSTWLNNLASHFLQPLKPLKSRANVLRVIHTIGMEKRTSLHVLKYAMQLHWSLKTQILLIFRSQSFQKIEEFAESNTHQGLQVALLYVNW